MHIPKNDPLIGFRPWFPAFTDITETDFDAAQALEDFFDAYSVQDVRQKLWAMHKSALLNDNEYETPLDLANLTYFFERLNDLVNAGYLIALAAYLKKKNTNNATGN